MNRRSENSSENDEKERNEVSDVGKTVGAVAAIGLAAWGIGSLLFGRSGSSSSTANKEVTIEAAGRDGSNNNPIYVGYAPGQGGEDTYWKPPPREDTCWKPPPREDTYWKPPPREDTCWKPPPREDTCWNPPPREDTCWKPPPREDTCWKPPPRDFFKLNTDGSGSDDSVMAGAGGVVRDHNGKWIVGFRMCIGPDVKSFDAELVGVREGLKLAYDRNLMPLMVELDAEVIVGILNKKSRSSNSAPYRPIIYECRELLTKLKVDTVDHIRRGGNKCANLLSRQGREGSKNFLVILDDPPIEIRNNMKALGEPLV